MSDSRSVTVPGDRYLMPWLIPAFDDGPVKDCVLIASMEGHEMLSISLHVSAAAAGEEPAST